jgi:hypothetical protein
MQSAHAKETLNRWLEMERAEHEYRRWAAFFYPLMDKPELGQMLCELCLSVIRRQIPAGSEARSAVERVLRQLLIQGSITVAPSSIEAT